MTSRPNSAAQAQNDVLEPEVPIDSGWYGILCCLPLGAGYNQIED